MLLFSQHGSFFTASGVLGYQSGFGTVVKKADRHHSSTGSCTGSSTCSTSSFPLLRSHEENDQCHNLDDGQLEPSPRHCWNLDDGRRQGRPSRIGATAFLFGD